MSLLQACVLKRLLNQNMVRNELLYNVRLKTCNYYPLPKTSLISFLGVDSGKVWKHLSLSLKGWCVLWVRETAYCWSLKCDQKCHGQPQAKAHRPWCMRLCLFFHIIKFHKTWYICLAEERDMRENSSQDLSLTMHLHDHPSYFIRKVIPAVLQRK